MKCDVIQDLLPLYAEHLCSSESRKLIDKHLASCELCKKNLAHMVCDLTADEMSQTEIDNYLKEKDLLSNSKKLLEYEGLKKVTTVIFYITSILNLLFIVLILISVLFGYGAKYPKIYWGETGLFAALVLLFMIVTPLVICLFGLLVAKKKVYKKQYKSILLLCSILLIPAYFLSVSGGIVTYMVPPVISYTDNTDNYLIIDNYLDKYAETVSAFFPEKIPQNAMDIHYSYSKYSDFFDDTLKINASWTLPADEYETIKQQISISGHMERLSNKTDYFQIILTGVPYHHDLKTYIEFNDEQKIISYTVDTSSN